MKTDTRIITPHKGMVDPFNWSLEDFDPRDIANSLANTCRFGGHTPTGCYYSVAEHSLLMAEYASLYSGPHVLELRLACLLHDAAEAYIGDIRTPFKGLNDLWGLLAVEQSIQAQIYEAHGIESLAIDSVKPIDDVFKEREMDWLSNRDELVIWYPQCLSPEQAYIDWLAQYYYLCGLWHAYSKAGDRLRPANSN